MKMLSYGSGLGLLMGGEGSGLEEKKSPDCCFLDCSPGKALLSSCADRALLPRSHRSEVVVST